MSLGRLQTARLTVRKGRGEICPFASTVRSFLRHRGPAEAGRAPRQVSRRPCRPREAAAGGTGWRSTNICPPWPGEAARQIHAGRPGSATPQLSSRRRAFLRQRGHGRWVGTATTERDASVPAGTGYVLHGSSQGLLTG